MPTDEQQIRDLVETWMAATKAGDSETVLSLMTEDVVFLMPGRTPMIGRAAFAEASNANANAGGERPEFEGTSEIQEIKVLGDWAYIWAKLKVVVTPPGSASPIMRAGPTLSILQKQNGRWLMARDANMLAPVTTP